ncbi:helix-turn-helix domain-containing protein [Xanthobacter aminoxidans]|uniref:helix-turn-helix domain-containing protein n=1 Tax=Xanthobacter aminoxidans TaxID=186280 RepID=UPI0020231452|nr:helix-turn-helix domain-containing protein [Xanthobacter aminoxidans]MCL8385858.1 helix-turn-helix domain-containing protein [Xanthobacter aminoxidans]
MSTSDRPIRTSKQIAHELGISQRTVTRWTQKGILPATKTGSGGRTSPLEVDRRAVEKLKKKA